MPSSIQAHTAYEPSAAVVGARLASHLPQASHPHFEVVPFRRTADGAIVPGPALEVSNSEIAWRWVRAAVQNHDYVGAVALTGSDVVHTGKFTDGALLTTYGEVNLAALSG